LSLKTLVQSGEVSENFMVEMLFAI
jgi:hypothetical protein